MSAQVYSGSESKVAERERIICNLLVDRVGEASGVACPWPERKLSWI